MIVGQGNQCDARREDLRQPAAEGGGCSGARANARELTKIIVKLLSRRFKGVCQTLPRGSLTPEHNGTGGPVVI